MASSSSSSTIAPCSTGCMTTSTSAGNSDDDTSDSMGLFADHVTTFRRACSPWLDEDISREDRQVFLSVVFQHGRLGAAYYDIEDVQMCMMLDCEESTEFNTLRRVLEQVQPTCVVIGAKQEEKFRKGLQAAVSELLLDDQTSLGDVVQVLPSLDFSFEICKRRIMGLKLPFMPDNLEESERIIHLSSLVSMDDVCMVRATGGLLKYLEKARVGIELEDSNVRVPLIDLTVFTLDDQMIIDENVLSSLRIFQRDCHPSGYKSNQGKNAKEGLSLFGVMNRCKSSLGRKMLRQWFLGPSKDITVLKNRQEAIAFFVDPQNFEVTTSIQSNLKNIRAVPDSWLHIVAYKGPPDGVLRRMIQSAATTADWQALYKTSSSAAHIADLCRAQTKVVPVFTEIGKRFTEGLQRIATLIHKLVDFEESVLEGRFVVKPGVVSELDEIKRIYNGLPHFMTKIAQDELQRLNPVITECKIVYVPQMGFLLTVPITEKMMEEDNYDIPGLEFMYMVNEIVHYKSKSTKALDDLLGDTHHEIADEEIRIMLNLQSTVLKHSNVLTDVMYFAAELDCLLCLASCAKEFNYVRPELTQDRAIHIIAGRHPLQEMCSSPFVPNDFHSGGDNSRVKILTGPNASGKSVYIRQVALIVYMAHLGSFVPVESARICIVDRIFSRVQTSESVSLGLSAFMVDLNQMSDALRNSTENSLVIIDEFGKGTGSMDGVSLLCSALKYWLSKGICSPHILVCTHFHSLIRRQLIPRSLLSKVTFQTMDIFISNGELVFLYRLIDGYTGSSFAITVATEEGIRSDTLTRAAEVSKLYEEHKPIEREETARSVLLMKRYSFIAARFVELDVETAELYPFLRNVVLPACKDDDDDA